MSAIGLGNSKLFVSSTFLQNLNLSDKNNVSRDWKEERRKKNKGLHDEQCGDADDLLDALV